MYVTRLLFSAYRNAGQAYSGATKCFAPLHEYADSSLPSLENKAAHPEPGTLPTYPSSTFFPFCFGSPWYLTIKGFLRNLAIIGA